VHGLMPPLTLQRQALSPEWKSYTGTQLQGHVGSAMHSYMLVIHLAMSSQTYTDCWPHSHKMVTTTLSLSSTTTLAMPPSTDNATNLKLDRHSRPSSLRHNCQPGKQLRHVILTAAANMMCGTSKEHHATSSHYTMPHQLTP
jgi:hypothetical protein